MYSFNTLSPNEFENLAADLVGAIQNRYFQRFWNILDYMMICTKKSCNYHQTD